MEGANLVELTLEGYGPGGAAILVQAISDNRNRTLQDVRNIFLRGGGSLGESGCVAWLFDLKGLISVETDDLDAEELVLQAIDAGAEDVKVENNYVEIYTKLEELEAVRTALEQENLPVASAELSMIPKTMVELEEKAALQTLKLLDKLEELDEVRHVSSNTDFPNAILEKYQLRV
jgi:YebC/PmpR family DNA-binding regulatory protein